VGVLEQVNEALNRNVTLLQASHAETLATKDREIEQLRASSASALEEKQREIEALRASSALVADPQELETLRAELQSTKKNLESEKVCVQIQAELTCSKSAAMQSRQTFLVYRDREVKKLQIELKESQTSCSDLQKQASSAFVGLLLSLTQPLLSERASRIRSSRWTSSSRRPNVSWRCRRRPRARASMGVGSSLGPRSWRRWWRRATIRCASCVRS